MPELAEAIQQRLASSTRLAAVQATRLLDSPAEEAFDRLARLAAVVLEAPLAFVTVVDEQRSYWKACIGVDASAPGQRQNPVHESFCQYVIGLDAELVVGDVTADPRTHDNPAITGMGVRAWAGFPVRSPDGEALGSFCVVDTEVREWTTRDVEVLRTLAHAASGEVALRAAAERSAGLARTLQETLLPGALPQVPGMDVAALYRPGGEGTEVMGDFYDVFESADGRWNVVLGDVCGKGVKAARLTALSRYALRTEALHAHRPGQALEALNEVLLHDDASDDRFVTAVHLTVDPVAGGVRAMLASAGHVPVIVRGAAGTRQVTATGPLVGVLPDVQIGDVPLDLRPGDVLVLCTDGVTEARTAHSEQFGVERLTEVVRDASGDARTIAGLIDAAAMAWGGSPAQDDVAILVLRVR